MKTRSERFWDKVLFTANECWIWNGALSGDGYGCFWDGERLTGAHRFAYQQLVGKIPLNMEIHHNCKNTKCVNPKHFDIVTHLENMKRDGWKEVGHWNTLKTHCPHGHQYTKDNTYIYRETNGGLGRNCRTCMGFREQKKKPPPVTVRDYIQSIG